MKQRERVIALGFFDGVHLGHGALLRRTAERSAEMGAVPAAFTFDRHPESVIPGREPVPLINSPTDRGELMHRLYGIREVIMAHFGQAMMRMDWRDFVTDLLIERYRAVHLIAGHDFHFGYRGEGNAERLSALCAEKGIGCDIIPPVTVDGITVSSTHIRSLIARGEMERANEFLGHPWQLTGRVEHGKKLGSRLGFPTVNLHIPPDGVIPAFGVYATQVWVGERPYAAVTNVGVRPTVDENGAVTVEGFLLDFDDDLYGRDIRMEFYRRIRPERKFETLDALRAQVMADAETVRQYFL